MGDINHISSIVRILEDPLQKTSKKRIPRTEFRAQFPQTRKNSIIKLVSWGKLSQDIANYYKTDDYIIVEGYLSLRKDKKATKNQKFPKKKPELTVLKVYPFLLSNSPSKSKN